MTIADRERQVFEILVREFNQLNDDDYGNRWRASAVLDELREKGLMP